MDQIKNPTSSYRWKEKQMYLITLKLVIEVFLFAFESV